MNMKKVRITKIFNFEMGHFLYNHDGNCKNIHGHSYKLEVTIIGNILNRENNPKDGMVIDFSILKNLIKENLIKKLDHSFIININSPNKEILKVFQDNNFKITEVPYQTTSENMVCDFAERIQKILPPNISLFSLKLYETETSFVEWFKSDNEQ